MTTKKKEFEKNVGKNSSKLGSVNAASAGKVYNNKGNLIGYCMDTPNNVAYAFLKFENATLVKGFLGSFKRNSKDIQDRMKFVEYDAEYHKNFIKAV